MSGAVVSAEVMIESGLCEASVAVDSVAAGDVG